VKWDSGGTKAAEFLWVKRLRGFVALEAVWFITLRDSGLRGVGAKVGWSSRPSESAGLGAFRARLGGRCGRRRSCLFWHQVRARDTGMAGGDWLVGRAPDRDRRQRVVEGRG